RRLLRRDSQSGSIELEALPTTYRHANWRAALRPRTCSAFNSSTGHRALRPRPHFIRYRQAAACPRAAQKTQTYRSLRFPAVAALVPSAGTITLQIELRSDADAQAPRIRCVSARAR